MLCKNFREQKYFSTSKATKIFSNTFLRNLKHIFRTDQIPTEFHWIKSSNIDRIHSITTLQQLSNNKHSNNAQNFHRNSQNICGCQVCPQNVAKLFGSSSDTVDQTLKVLIKTRIARNSLVNYLSGWLSSNESQNLISSSLDVGSPNLLIGNRKSQTFWKFSEILMVSCSTLTFMGHSLLLRNALLTLWQPQHCLRLNWRTRPDTKIIKCHFQLFSNKLFDCEFLLIKYQIEAGNSYSGQLPPAHHQHCCESRTEHRVELLHYFN